MKQHYFVKYAPQIRKLTGCSRSTEILGKLEFWFSKMPDGFYKFIEPCSHRLYREGDSWTEELDCDRKSFASSFEKIGVRYKSRRAFEKAEDKFQEKMYASYYDRNHNQMFFVRNHDIADKVLIGLFPTKKNASKKEDNTTSKASDSLTSDPLRNGKNSRSYKEPESTPSELFKNNSHASNEIVKKMIEIWTAIVEEGREQIALSDTTVPFLKKAFTDKFESSLQKWKEYCISIARSKFLMGEKTSFKAKLDWALLFKNIQKVLDGNYGIGDRTPKTILPSQNDLGEEITNSCESQEVKDFRLLCLKTVGNARYISYFKNLTIEFRGEGEVALIAPHAFSADLVERQCSSYLRHIFNQLKDDATSLTIFTPGETKGRLIEQERGGEIKEIDSNEVQVTNVQAQEEQLVPEIYEAIPDVKNLEDINPQTKMLRESLKESIPPKQFPSWLGKIEVEEIKEDGTMVVTLEDSLMVDWCRSRFSQEILQSARDLWNNVERLIIQQKLDERLPSSVEKRSEDTKMEKKSTLEQAIQSLLFACSVPRPMGAYG